MLVGRIQDRRLIAATVNIGSTAAALSRTMKIWSITTSGTTIRQSRRVASCPSVSKIYEPLPEPIYYGKWNNSSECPPPLCNECWQSDHAPFHGYRNIMQGAMRIFPGADAAHHCSARSLVVSTYERISRRDGAQHPRFHDQFSPPAMMSALESAIA